MGQIHQKLEALRARNYSFRTLGKRLHEFGMPSAQGWTNLLEKHREDPADVELISTWSNALDNALLDDIRYGSRAVSIYDLDKETASTLVQHAPEWINQESPYLSTYPTPLTQNELSTTASGPFVSATESLENNGCRIVICAKRYVKSREEISISSLEQNVQDSLTGYEEIFGIRCSYAQGYDSFHIHPEDNRIEIHLDMSCHMTGDDILQARNRHISLVEEWGSRILGRPLILGPARNFFPLVRSLYNQPDGAVPNLGHATTTASIKDERMRRKTADLRTEPFHQGGLAGVDNLTDLYSITKTWERLSTGVPVLSLTIPGHFGLVGSPNARVDYAIISHCTSESDFTFVMSKLL